MSILGHNTITWMLRGERPPREGSYLGRFRDSGGDNIRAIMWRADRGWALSTQDLRNMVAWAELPGIIVPGEPPEVTNAQAPMIEWHDAGDPPDTTRVVLGEVSFHGDWVVRTVAHDGRWPCTVRRWAEVPKPPTMRVSRDFTSTLPTSSVVGRLEHLIGQNFIHKEGEAHPDRATFWVHRTSWRLVYHGTSDALGPSMVLWTLSAGLDVLDRDNTEECVGQAIEGLIALVERRFV